MSSREHATVQRYLKQGASVAGMVSLSVIITVLVMRGLAPPQAVAQPGQADEVRASAFVLVGQDGTVLARLTPGRQGGGSLRLFDTAGNAHLGLGGAGALEIYGSDGTTFRLRAGITQTGEQLMVVFDAEGKPRLRVGELPGGIYGLVVLDADGQPVATFP